MKWLFRIFLMIAITISVVAIFINTDVWDYIYVLVQANWELIYLVIVMLIFKRLYSIGLIKISKSEYYVSIVGFYALISSAVANVFHGLLLYFAKTEFGAMTCEYYENLWGYYWKSMFWYWAIYGVVFLILMISLLISLPERK